MTLRLDQCVTSSTMTIGGSPYVLENNCWVLGDDDECVVIDAPHDADAILALVGSRRVTSILVTHAHADHVNAAEGLRRRTGAPVYLHPDDRELWEKTCSEPWDKGLSHGFAASCAGQEILVRHTPGHTPGSCVLYVPSRRELFSGDTLFPGGPGKTNSPGEFAQIMASLRTQVFADLDDDVVVRPGHGDSTTIGVERPHLGEWEARGW